MVLDNSETKTSPGESKNAEKIADYIIECRLLDDMTGWHFRYKNTTTRQAVLYPPLMKTVEKGNYGWISYPVPSRLKPYVRDNIDTVSIPEWFWQDIV